MTSTYCHGSVLCYFLSSPFSPFSVLSPPFLSLPSLSIFTLWMASTSPMTLYDTYMLKIPIYISAFHWSFKLICPAAGIHIYLDVSPASPTYRVQIWTSSDPLKPLLFQCSPFLKGALAENPEIVLISFFSSHPTFLTHSCQLYFQNRSQIWPLSIIPHYSSPKPPSAPGLAQ